MHDQKIVRFDIYCETCSYKDYPEEAIPCCDCLNEPYNIDSRKPVYFKDKSKEKIIFSKLLLNSIDDKEK